jgi:hypothetical protein
MNTNLRALFSLGRKSPWAIDERLPYSRLPEKGFVVLWKTDFDAAGGACFLHLIELKARSWRKM